MKPPHARPAFFWFAAVLSVLVAAAYCFTFYSALRQNWRPGSLGWDVVEGVSGLYVTGVDPDGPARGKLLPGDYLLAVNGETRAAEYGPQIALASARPGTRYTVTVARAGDKREYTIEVAAYSGAHLLNLIPIAFTSLLLYAVGVCIGLLKPEDLTTRLAFAAFMAGALLFLATVLSAYQLALHGPLLVVALAIRGFWWPFHLPLGYDFLSRFPQPVEEHWTWRLARVGLYVLACLVWIPAQVNFLVYALGLDSASQLLPPWISPPGAHREGIKHALQLGASVGMCLVLVRNYRALPDADARRRIRWAGLGLACSIFPYALMTVIHFVIALSGRRHLSLMGFFTAAAWISMLMVAAAPVALAYSILKHRVLGIRVAVRRGVQYLLARNVLRVIVLLPVIAIVWQAVTHPDLGLGEVLLGGSKGFYLFLAASAAMSLRYRKQMTEWVDRKFFRTAYQQEQILLSLIEHVKRSDSTDEISSVVAGAIDMALHPLELYILCRKNPNDDLSTVYPSSSPGVQPLAPVVSESLRLKATGPTLSCFELEDYLCVPMIGTDQAAVGALLLGPKKSEEPYTKRDCDLLLALAGQIAVVLEVIWLKGRMRVEEKIRLEVLARLDNQQINLIKECPACGLVYDSTASVCEQDRSELTHTLPVERVVDGKYRLDHRIGTGGMSAVFQASDLRLHRTVAVKIMMGRLFGNQAALRRFEREARAAAKLDHRNIVSIYDFGRLCGDGGYLVMQQVRGRSWRSELRSSRQVAPASLAGWLGQLCEAIETAHAQGVIHRDLKPENVIISHDENGNDRIVVLDFGLAKMRAEEPSVDSCVTDTGVVLGTYAYMSPEQRAGREVDARSDIYSLGVMAIETIAGQRPPQSGSVLAWIRAALPADTAASEVLAEILSRCLADHPEDRFSSVAELKQQLIPAILGSPPFRAVAATRGDADTWTLKQ